MNSRMAIVPVAGSIVTANILCISDMLFYQSFSDTEAFDACFRFLHVM